MLPQGIAHPKQLAILTKALEHYCQVAHIEPGTAAHDDVGRQIMFLYECGISSAEELVKLLRYNNHIGH